MNVRWDEMMNMMAESHWCVIAHMLLAHVRLRKHRIRGHASEQRIGVVCRCLSLCERASSRATVIGCDQVADAELQLMPP